MNESIRRRGPDDDGYFLESGIGLAMRRLSILDLSGGRQPVFNEDKTVCVVFNGEIYNFRQLRQDLQALGHRFCSHSDTEVLVHLYEEYGKDLVHHLRGMFTFALWDMKAKILFIARDRLGIKPLYYARIGNSVIFGSELKCLLSSNLIQRTLDLQAVDAFLAFTYIPAPRTIFADVYKLEPGHLLWVENGKLSNEEYWDIEFNRQNDSIDEQEWAGRITEALQSAITCHLESDVPIGAFLSGGVDSSIVVAMMAENVSDPVNTFTMGFGGNSPLLDERRYAKELAGLYPLKYNEFTVSPDLTTIIDEVVQAFDEPFADDSVVPSYYISQLTARQVKVALSGLGGDELFAGYHRYRGFYLSNLYSRLPRTIHRLLINPLVQALPEPQSGGDRIDHIKRFSASATLSPANRYLSYVSSQPSELRRRLYLSNIKTKIDFDGTARYITDPFRNAKAGNDIDRMLYTDFKTYLPDDILTLSDRLSMWHSLELRVPLVDHKLVELCASMPFRLKLGAMSQKRILKKVAERWLPSSIIYHRKQGFESPMASWLRNDLSGLAHSLLAPERIESMGVFDPDYVQELLNQHMAGRQKNNKILFSLMMFSKWFELYMS